MENQKVKNFINILSIFPQIKNVEQTPHFDIPSYWEFTISIDEAVKFLQYMVKSKKTVFWRFFLDEAIEMFVPSENLVLKVIINGERK